MKLQCLTCDRVFNEHAVAIGIYHLDTLICGHCYARMQSLPHSESCFGKPTVKLADGKRLLGYNPEAEECSTWCPDRKVCAKVLAGESL